MQVFQTALYVMSQEGSVSFPRSATYPQPDVAPSCFCPVLNAIYNKAVDEREDVSFIMEDMNTRIEMWIFSRSGGDLLFNQTILHSWMQLKSISVCLHCCEDKFEIKT